MRNWNGNFSVNASPAEYHGPFLPESFDPPFSLSWSYICINSFLLLDPTQSFSVPECLAKSLKC